MSEKPRLIATVAECAIDGDVVITDPCYLVHGYKQDNHSDWMSILSSLNLNPYIESSTLYGDWGCTVFDSTNAKNNEIGNPIGEFCADAGLVCVCELSNLLKKNPKFEDWIKDHNWCVSVIKNFKGTVKINKYEIEDENHNKENVIMIDGDGIKDNKKFQFVTVQTSL